MHINQFQQCQEIRQKALACFINHSSSGATSCRPADQFRGGGGREERRREGGGRCSLTSACCMRPRACQSHVRNQHDLSSAPHTFSLFPRPSRSSKA
eukprot:764442-Hanusia_phi.AAC.5